MPSECGRCPSFYFGPRRFFFLDGVAVFFSACLSQEHSECGVQTTVTFFLLVQKAGGPLDTLSCPFCVLLSQFFLRTCGTDLCKVLRTVR